MQPRSNCQRAGLRRMQKSVLGTELTGCCTDPMTGFFRDGTCQTGPTDVGQHTVCVELTREFLEFTRARGNDLITPRPEFEFPGLKPGDCWCVCVESWLEAVNAEVPHRVDLGATHHSVIEYCNLETLRQHAIED